MMLTADSEDFHMLLRKTCDSSFEPTWQAHFWVPKLFKVVSLVFVPESLSILREWIDKGDAEKIEAAYHAEVSLA